VIALAAFFGFGWEEKLRLLLSNRIIVGTCLRLALFGLSFFTLSALSRGWEPITHVALAQMALADALDDGKVSIYRVNSIAGQVLEKVGDYPVEPTLLEALRENPKQYYAGVFGPDAFPDILTGQQCIHPGDNPRDGDQIDVANEPGEGTDAWLTHIWSKSRSSSKPVKAFVAGYLTHAAGDMFAHTLVNYYAGGKFVIGSNGARHVIIEGYMGKRGPHPVYESSIAGVENFIYQNLIRMDPGSDLTSLYVGSGRRTSVPFIFSRLRNKLQADLDAYRSKSSAQRTAYDISHPFEMAYIEAWIIDIDEGLKLWPKLSYDLALKLFFNPDGMDLNKATDLANDYVNQHLLSMAGLPDFVGTVRGLSDALVDRVLTEEEQDRIRELKKSLIEKLFHEAGLPSPGDVKAYLKNPETNFNAIVGPGSLHNDLAHNISLQSFNQNILHLQDPAFNNPSEKWTVDSFAPAHNTLTLSKIILLSRDTVNRLVRDLQSKKTSTTTSLTAINPITSPTISTTPTLTVPKLDAGLANLGPLFKDNVMLGWQDSLDDDNQWHVNAGKLVFVTAGVYDQLFMNQVGVDSNPPQALPKKTVSVKIRRTKQVDDLDIDVPGFGGADFYAAVTIDSELNTTSTVDDDDDITPNWTESLLTPKPLVDITIELFDADSLARGGDDACDINPRSNRKGLHLVFNAETGAITGDASGSRGQEIHVRGEGDSDRAEIYFTIDIS
jgi:hypothetical protein